MQLARPGRAGTGQPTVYFDRWQSTAELGTAPRSPLLRADMRVPDQPGAVLNAIESLGEALNDVIGGPVSRHRWHEWCAKAIADGGVTRIHLTIMLPARSSTGHRPAGQAQSLGPAEISQIERRTLGLLTHKLAAIQKARSLPDSMPGTSPAMAVSIQVIHTGISG